MGILLFYSEGRTPPHPIPHHIMSYSSFSKGRSLAKKGDFASALPLLEASASGDSSDSKRLYWLGAVLVELRRYEEGISTLSRALSSTAGKKRIQVLYAKGFAHNALKQYRDASSCMEEAVQLSRQHKVDALELCRGINHLATARLHTGELTTALELVGESLSLMRSKKVDPKSTSSSILARGLLVQDAEAVKLAEEALEVALKQDSREGSVLISDIRDFLAARTLAQSMGRAAACVAVIAFCAGGVLAFI